MPKNDQPKILYLTNARIPTERAHGFQIVNTVRALHRLGASVDLVVPKRHNSTLQTVSEFYGVDELKVTYLSSPATILESSLPSVFFPLNRMFFCLQAVLFARRHEASAVFTRDLLLAWWIQLLSSKKVVYEHHEPKKSRQWLELWLLRRLRKKIIVAKGLETYYQKNGISRDTYTWVPNGVDVEKIDAINPDKSKWQEKFGIPMDKKVILYSGHFYDWKGVPTLLEAAPNLPKDFVLVLIGGSGEAYERVVTKVKEARLDNIYIQGFALHHELMGYVKSADVLVVPNTAKEERSSSYTTPIKLFEYMAARVPIVASDIPSLRWFLESGRNAELFTADDAQAFIAAIEHVLSDSNYAMQLADNAASEVGRYTWDTRAEKILSFV